MDNNAHLTEKQELAFDALKRGKNVFLTGPAGSGKTFLLKKFIEWYKKNKEMESNKIYITATTGLSASLIEGTTIHSYSGIGTGQKDINDIYKNIIKFSSGAKKRWLETGVLIIDEISMMEASIFDKLEILAKKIRKSDDPFGGIQVILSGDFLQLPPVKSTTFCFEAISWDIVIDKVFYFDKIIRQRDEKLQEVLNNIRIGIVNDRVKSLLNSCLNKKLENTSGIIPTYLFSKRDVVLNYNTKELKKLIDEGHETHTYTAEYIFPEKKKITDEAKEFLINLINTNRGINDTLTLSVGSQVMLITNQLSGLTPEEASGTKNTIFNGSRGIVVGFETGAYDKKYPIVSFLSGETLTIKPHTFEYESDKQTIGKSQIPLILAWAITIHKAQGMSLDYLQTDIGKDIFEYGQIYVVLSRIRNIEGLSLFNIDYSKIRAHPKILSYYSDLE
jgi:ATP-dependent DNA helicase PIF1